MSPVEAKNMLSAEIDETVATLTALQPSVRIDAMLAVAVAAAESTMRVLFVTSDEARAKLLEAVGDGNKPKAASAPAIAVIAHDMEFYKHLGRLAPHLDPDSFAAQDEEKLKMQASNNTWLQGGYLILAARALGLDCGPMSGFNPAKVNELFFADSSWRASFLLSLGYGSGNNIRPPQCSIFRANENGRTFLWGVFIFRFIIPPVTGDKLTWEGIDRCEFNTVFLMGLLNTGGTQMF